MRFPRLRNREPLCPKCSLAMELARDCDAWMCPSPICSGAVTREAMRHTPRWLRVTGPWRIDWFEVAARRAGWPVRAIPGLRRWYRSESGHYVG